ncbi:MAG: hypothetical protein B6242_00030 [Anaerolineaceae bacterium 4572_78]|nr:MAG: hypothetical protein B6242_00030 [Anaerolineaceae bacterium 4572_78]
MTDKKILTCINPATGEKFDEITMATAEDVATAYKDMRRAKTIWQQKSVHERVRILRQFQSVMVDALDEITSVINQDCGKSRQDALLEVFVTLDLLREYCNHAPKWLAREYVPSGLQFFKRGYIEHRPYGVVLIIAPWNYPFNLALAPVLSALFAGNTVLLKSSKTTAATGKLIESLFKRVPELEPFIRIVHGDSSVGRMLVKSAPDHIFLTGSGATASKILHDAADNLTPVTCELGGKDAMIVLDDADVEKAAKWGVWGAFFNAGQTCMSVERVYVHASIYDEFVWHVVAETESIQMGYHKEMVNFCLIGSMTTSEQVDLVEEHLADAVAKGAKILAGGRRQDNFFEPTILVDVDHTMKVMQEESFGPFIPIMKVSDEAEAIRLANDSIYGLSAIVWGKDIKRAERVGHYLEAGTVIINDVLVHFGNPLLPFGGVKESGNGRSHGRAGLLGFTEPHSYMIGNPPYSFDIATMLREPGQYHANSAILHLIFGTSPKQKLRPILKDKETISKAVKLTMLGTTLGIGFKWLWHVMKR